MPLRPLIYFILALWLAQPALAADSAATQTMPSESDDPPTVAELREQRREAVEEAREAHRERIQELRSNPRSADHDTEVGHRVIIDDFDANNHAVDNNHDGRRDSDRGSQSPNNHSGLPAGEYDQYGAFFHDDPRGRLVGDDGSGPYDRYYERYDDRYYDRQYDRQYRRIDDREGRRVYDDGREGVRP